MEISKHEIKVDNKFPRKKSRQRKGHGLTFQEVPHLGPIHKSSDICIIICDNFYFIYIFSLIQNNRERKRKKDNKNIM